MNPSLWWVLALGAVNLVVLGWILLRLGDRDDAQLRDDLDAQAQAQAKVQLEALQRVEREGLLQVRGGEELLEAVEVGGGHGAIIAR